MSVRHWSLLILTAFLFGSSFSLISIAVESLPPMFVATARVVIAAPIMWVVLRALGGRVPPIGLQWFHLLVLGTLTAAVPYVALAFGQERISSSLGGILFAMIPVFTMFIAPMFLEDERLTSRRFLGVAVAFSGVVLLLGASGLAKMDGQAVGALVTLLAALSYSLGGIYARLRADIPPPSMAAGQMICAALLLIPLAGSEMRTIVALSMGGALTLIALAVVSTAAPVFLMFKLVREVGAGATSLLAFLMPAFSVLIGIVVLGEELQTVQIVGFVLILSGARLSSSTRNKK